MWSSPILAMHSPQGAPHNSRLVNPRHYSIDMSRLLDQAWVQWIHSTTSWRIPETTIRVPMEKTWVDSIHLGSGLALKRKCIRASLLSLSFYRSLSTNHLLKSCLSITRLPLRTIPTPKPRTQTSTSKRLVHNQTTMQHTRTKRSTSHAMKPSSKASKSSISSAGRNSQSASSSKQFPSEHSASRLLSQTSG